MHRRFTIAKTLLTIAGVSTVLAWASPPAAPPAGAPTPDEALQKLQIGNARYLCGKADRPNSEPQRRIETFRGGQHPIAAVLTCADSRVPAEIIFDQGIGDVFTVRSAGNIADRVQLGSIEYAVGHLNVPVVVVMGHRACGAVAAAAAKAEVHGNLAAVVEAITPAVERARKHAPNAQGDSLIAEAVKTNVWMGVEKLLGSSEIAERVSAQKLRVVGAVYDLESGTITWLGQHPDQSQLLKSGPDTEQHASGSGGKVAGEQHQAGETQRPKPPAAGGAKSNGHP